MKVLFYEIRIKGQDVVIKDSSTLKRVIKEVNQELDNTRFGTARYKELTREAAQLKLIQEGLRNEVKDTQRSIVQGADEGRRSYRALNAELLTLKNRYKELSEAERQSDLGGALRNKIAGLSSELKVIDRQLGDNFRNVGNYRSALSGLFGGLVGGIGLLGVSVGAESVAGFIRESSKAFAEFNQQIKVVQAISGASEAELGRLEARARSLGETTQFTAFQVAELQKELALRGFNTDQILASVDDIVNIAIATNEPLKESAEAVASTLTSLQIPATETKRVVDILSASFNNSASGLSQWQTAIQYVGPVASAANVDLSALAATTGVLADAGLRAETQGTSLRKILTLLTNENSKLSKALGVTVTDTDSYIEAIEKLSKSQVSNADAYKLVGAEAQSALVILSQSGDRLIKLQKQFQNVNGEAQRTALIVGDTFKNDVLRLQSAIEGLQINLFELSEEGFREVLQSGNAFLSILNDFLKIPLSEKIREEQSELNALVGVLTDATASEESRSFAIQELNLKYPDFVKNIDIEKATTEQLVVALQAANNEYTKRIALQQSTEQLEKISRQRGELAKEIFDLEKRREQLENGDGLSRGERLRARTGVLREVSPGRSTRDVALLELETKRGEAQGKLNDLKQREIDLLKEVGERQAALNKLLGETGKLTGDIPGEDDGKGKGKGLGDKIQGIGDAAKAAEGSISFFEDRIRDLRKAISETADSTEITTLLSKLSEAEKDLEGAKQKVDDLRRVQEFFGVVSGDRGSQVQATDERSRVPFFNQLPPTPEGVFGPTKEEIDKAIDNAENGKLRLLAALRSQFTDEKDFARQREILYLQTELEIAEIKKAQFEVGSTAYLELSQRQADIEVEINKKKNEKLVQQDDEARKLRENVLAQLTQGLFNTLQKIADSTFKIEQSAIEAQAKRRIELIEEEFGKRIELEEEGSLAAERLAKEREVALREAEKKALEEKKKSQIAQARINTLLAVGNAFATVQPFFPAAVIAAAFALAQGVALESEIRKQKYARGGVVKGNSHAQGGVPLTVRSTGQQVELEGEEGVINRRSMLSNDVLTLKGTPREIASALNSYKGYGVSFSGVPASRVMFERGGVIMPGSNNNSGVQKQEIEVSVSVSDEQIDKMASVIAGKVGDSTYEGSFQGNSDGLRLKERVNALNQKIQR